MQEKQGETGRNRKKQEEQGKEKEWQTPPPLYIIYIGIDKKGVSTKRGVCGRGDYGQTSHTATEWVAGTNFGLSIFHFQLNHYLCVPQNLRNTEL